MSAFNILMRELEKNKRYSKETNDIELEKILNKRKALYDMIELVEKYDELMDGNQNFKTTGNLYSNRGVELFTSEELLDDVNKSFYSELKKRSLAYEQSKSFFITSNLGLIINEIVFDNQDNYLDLFQDAAIYFQRSFNLYDVNNGAVFITFAVSHIKYSIFNSLKKNSLIKQNDKFKSVNSRIQEAKRNNPDKELNGYELSKLIPQFSIQEIDKALLFNQGTISMNARINYNNVDSNCESFEFGDSLCDEEIERDDVKLDKENFTKFLKKVLSDNEFFSDRDRRLLTMRFSIGLPDEYTLQEIGTQFGLTRERVRQIESKALKHLKKCFKDELLEYYECF